MVIVHISDQAKAQAPKLKDLASQLDDVAQQIIGLMSTLGLYNVPGAVVAPFAGSTATAFQARAPKAETHVNLANQLVADLQDAYGLYITDMQEVDSQARAKLHIA